MLFIIYLSYIILIQPLLEARAEIRKYFRWFFGSNEKFRICFGTIQVLRHQRGGWVGSENGNS